MYINPVFIDFGLFKITFYSLVYLFGIIVILIVLLNSIRKRQIDITKEQAYDVIFYSIIGMVIGARLFHVLFWGFSYYFNNLWDIFYIWEGGLSFHGGLIGIIFAIIIYTKLKKINFLKLADIIVIPGVFFLALGRITNFINQEIVGIVTKNPWCINFSGFEGCRHPVQLYAFIGRIALFFFLLYIARIKKHKDGFIFWSFILLIGFGRFMLDFLREDIRYFFLSSGQWLSIIMIIIGSYVLIKYYNQKNY